VAAMHGAHAQVPSAAEVSIALRLPGSTRRTVRDAVGADLTRTFGPRGTIHLVPTRDLGTWTSALGAVPRGRDPFAADVRLSEDQRQAVVSAIGDALLESELTVDELDAEVVRRTDSWAGELVMPAFQTFWPRWRQAVGDAARAGVLVFGAPRGRRVTYTHPRRLDPTFAPSGERALPSFLRGYLAAYGPSTPEHLARWLNAPEPWCRSLFDTADVEPVLVDGTSMWVNPGDTGSMRLGRSVQLLPYFDALAVGFVPREAMFPGRAAERALARNQAGNFPVLLVDGVVRGVWHQKRSGRRVAVTVETWSDLGPSRLRALHDQIARLGEILEASDITLTMGPVHVGPHA
jgi:winged helix DNA-binding protein